MSDISSLTRRIDAEFSAVEQKVKKFQEVQVEAHQQRQQRLEQLGKVFEQLRHIWQPRLEYLVEKFRGHVKATPRIIPSTREVTFDFDSRVARVRLKFAAFTDREVQKVILSYDLEIIPVLMQFQPHAELEFPLQQVDQKAVGQWMDDRIVDFVQTYFSLGENDMYMQGHMVEDPIARVTFPRMAAASSLEWGGQTYYFVGEETRREFEKQQGIGAK